MENLYEILEKDSKKILKTTKENKEKHGIGLKSVERITKKSGGFIDITTEEKLFKIVIYLPKSPRF